MSSINTLKKKQNNKIPDACRIVAQKGSELKTIYDNNIECYLYNKLCNIYLAGISIYDILENYYTAGKCYYLSAGIIHAMDDNAILVNGNLLPEDDGDGYLHQWVEFNFNGEWYVLDNCLPRSFEWCDLESSKPRVYDREQYYSIFMPSINFKKSKGKLMMDDFVIKHGELLRNSEWSDDDKLFFYYKGEQIEACKKRLYENIKVDENGHIISYNNPDIEKGHLK